MSADTDESRKKRFARALQKRELWTPEQLEAELEALAQEVAAMVESGQVTVCRPSGTNPDDIGTHARREMQSVLTAVGVA